jgi:hypothetical protein
MNGWMDEWMNGFIAHEVCDNYISSNAMTFKDPNLRYEREQWFEQLWSLPLWHCCASSGRARKPVQTYYEINFCLRHSPPQYTSQYGCSWVYIAGEQFKCDFSTIKPDTSFYTLLKRETTLVFKVNSQFPPSGGSSCLLSKKRKWLTRRKEPSRLPLTPHGALRHLLFTRIYHSDSWQY